MRASRARRAVLLGRWTKHSVRICLSRDAEKYRGTILRRARASHKCGERSGDGRDHQHLHAVGMTRARRRETPALEAFGSIKLKPSQRVTEGPRRRVD